MKTILVIDDLPENVFMLQDRLENEGYNIITAYDGKSGIEKVRSELPDLILLDIMMPGIDGFEVCRRLKNEITTRHIPVIFVTAKMNPADEAEGLALGAVAIGCLVR